METHTLRTRLRRSLRGPWRRGGGNPARPPPARARATPPSAPRPSSAPRSRSPGHLAARPSGPGGAPGGSASRRPASVPQSRLRGLPPPRSRVRATDLRLWPRKAEARRAPPLGGKRPRRGAPAGCWRRGRGGVRPYSESLLSELEPLELLLPDSEELLLLSREGPPEGAGPRSVGDRAGEGPRGGQGLHPRVSGARAPGPLQPHGAHDVPWPHPLPDRSLNRSIRCVLKRMNALRGGLQLETWAPSRVWAETPQASSFPGQ